MCLAIRVDKLTYYLGTFTVDDVVIKAEIKDSMNPKVIFYKTTH